MSRHRSIATSLAVAAALLFAAAANTGCAASSVEERAREHAADRLGVDASTLRVTVRSDLSTPKHAVLRVSARGRDRELTVAVARGGGALLVDGLEPDAFTRLAGAERMGERFEELGGARVAGWFGALSAGRPCGEPLMSPEQGESVQVEKLTDGAHRMSYRFSEGDKVMRCRLTVASDGSVREVYAEAAPVARATSSSATTLSR